MLITDRNQYASLAFDRHYRLEGIAGGIGGRTFCLECLNAAEWENQEADNDLSRGYAFPPTKNPWETVSHDHTDLDWLDDFHTKSHGQPAEGCTECEVKA